jgi:hypothetical protein
LRARDIAPAFESHLAKYRKLVPSIALINHLADGGTGPIPAPALARSLALAEYLEKHARRVYGAGPASEASAAKLILARIRKGDLQDGFTMRDIRRKQWSGLTTDEQIRPALDMLADFDWIAPSSIDTGGRPRIEFSINPEALR